MLSFLMSKVQIGDLAVDAYRLHTTPESHLYFYSQRGLSEALGMSKMALPHFLESETGKSILGKLLTLPQNSKNQGEISHVVEGTVVGQSFKIKGISCELASEIIFHYAMKGRAKAQILLKSLTEESLKLRAMSAFEVISVDHVKAEFDRINEQIVTRERHLCRSEHMFWNDSITRLGFDPLQAHEDLTLQIFGYRASESRKLKKPNMSDPVWSDTTVGINYHKDPNLFSKYRQAKNQLLMQLSKFKTNSPENYQVALRRALYAVGLAVKTGEGLENYRKMVSFTDLELE